MLSSLIPLDRFLTNLAAFSGGVVGSSANVTAAAALTCFSCSVHCFRRLVASRCNLEVSLFPFLMMDVKLDRVLVFGCRFKTFGDFQICFICWGVQLCSLPSFIVSFSYFLNQAKPLLLVLQLLSSRCRCWSRSLTVRYFVGC